MAIIAFTRSAQCMKVLLLRHVLPSSTSSSSPSFSAMRLDLRQVRTLCSAVASTQDPGRSPRDPRATAGTHVPRELQCEALVDWRAKARVSSAGTRTSPPVRLYGHTTTLPLVFSNRLLICWGVRAGGSSARAGHAPPSAHPRSRSRKKRVWIAEEATTVESFDTIRVAPISDNRHHPTSRTRR